LLYLTKIRGCIETQVIHIIYFFALPSFDQFFSEGQVKRKLKKKMKACIQSAIGETTPKVGCFTFANGLTTDNNGNSTENIFVG